MGINTCIGYISKIVNMESSILLLFWVGFICVSVQSVTVEKWETVRIMKLKLSKVDAQAACKNIVPLTDDSEDTTFRLNHATKHELSEVAKNIPDSISDKQFWVGLTGNTYADLKYEKEDASSQEIEEAEKKDILDSFFGGDDKKVTKTDTDCWYADFTAAETLLKAQPCTALASYLCDTKPYTRIASPPKRPASSAGYSGGSSDSDGSSSSGEANPWLFYVICTIFGVILFAIIISATIYQRMDCQTRRRNFQRMPQDETKETLA